MADPFDFPGPLNPDLDEREAFEAMRLYLEGYWERGLKASDDLGGLLGDLDTTLTKDGGPIDIAEWHDWLEAVAQVKAKRQNRVAS
jgi:hypothetical protein